MFDHLTPEDFARDTSARESQVKPGVIQNLGLNTGPIGYDLFVELWLQKCRDLAETDDDFTPFAVLSNAMIERYFEGEDDEVPADFARRLQREARQMNASWFFVAMVAPARAVYRDEETPKQIGGDLGEIQAALMSGDLDLCVCWTTTSAELGGQRRSRAGIMYLDDEGRIGQEIEAPLNPDTDPFNEVLR